MGRGLGLAAALGIARGHQGGLQVETRPGEGACFRLLLPPVAGVAEQLVEHQPVSRPWTGRGVLLVVDDEESVRTVTTRILSRAGFQVDVAADGKAGCDLFAANAGRYEAVLLDLTMPRMDGEEAFREIRRLRPNARVLLMSGYSPQEAVDRFSGKGLGGFLQKPFGPAALMEALRQLLEPAGDEADREAR